MNWDIVEGNWKQFKGKVKAQWGHLTDEQLEVIAGQRAELSGKIQEAYGITKDKADAQIKRFEKRNKDEPLAKLLRWNCCAATFALGERFLSRGQPAWPSD